MNTKAIEQFPANVQRDIQDSLTVVDEIGVEHANGEYTVKIGTAITEAERPADYRAYRVKNTDIYTAEEIEAFTDELPDYNAPPIF